jgi:FlaA1/EpsC-like NDP-sugar epimerase
MGTPNSITVFSRDEAKQHEMRLYYRHVVAATDEIVYNNFNQMIKFAIGDVRDYHRLLCSTPRR